MLTKNMDINDTSSSDICSTSEPIRKSSVEESNCTNSNGDSGYHSDLSGYHKDENFNRIAEDNGPEIKTSIQSIKSSSETHKLVSNSNILSYQNSETSCLPSNRMYNCSKDISVTSKPCNCHSDVNKTTVQNVVSDSYSSCSTIYVGRAATNGNPVSHGSHVSMVTCTLPDKNYSHSAPNHSFIKSERKTEEWKIIQDLAIKIEFCLMFGYTSIQIRSAITKLSYKATKNDILAELSSNQNGPAMGPNINMKSTFEGSPYNPNGVISKGIDINQDLDIQPRGPLSIENENKDGIHDRNNIDDSKNLRPIVIDGSNVAMSHGNKQVFSCKGILLAVDYFRKRNHRDITVFVPTYRKESARSDAVLKDREILDKLEEERILVYTPSRLVNGKRITCYDDRFILRLAEETEGIIVSNDNFRDLQNEKPEWKELVENRLLMYSFASDRFMPPDDPLGRNGPSIDNFLRKRPASEEQSKPQCPYGKKCTYGKKCKYFHPECARPISERMKEKSDKRLRASRESIELAVELYNGANSHNPTLADSTHSRDKSYLKPSSVQEAPNSIQEIKTYSSHRWEQENNEIQKHIASSMACEPQSYSRNHRNNQRQIPCSTASQNNFHHRIQPYHNHSINLPEAFRHMSVSNHYPVQSSHPPLSCGHSNNQIGYDAHCQQRYQLLNEAARLGYPTSPFVQPEPGPPDFHHENSVKNSPVNQPYQRSSPANLQIFERSNGGNAPMLHHQHVNQLSGPYPPIPDYRSYQISHNPIYPSGYRESFQNNQHLIHSYPIPPNGGRANPSMHPNMMPPSSYFVSQINSSGSNNSLSHSYPFVSPEKIMPPPISQRNLSNSSNASDPKTYPPRAPRGYSSGQHPEQHLRQAAYVNSSFAGAEAPSGHSGRINGEPPLNHVSNPRHHLYKNLCSLFQRHVVEAVMTAHPDVSEPKQIIQMCLESN